MIIVKVMGGLGNQLFQVAYAMALARQLNEEIFLDTSVYRTYKIRNFSIQHTKIGGSIKFINEAPISRLNKWWLKLTQKCYHVYQKVAKTLFRIEKHGKLPFKILSPIGLFYNFDRYYYEIHAYSSKIKCLYGYFQSEKYFVNYKDHIMQELKVSTPPTEREEQMIKELISCNAVGVSIRVGDDYVKSPILNVCTPEYFYQAMDYIHSKVNDAVFYIFSDDINRVKERFRFKYPVRYIEQFNDYESLRLLYTCKHFIISNSSFSWWGAYLSEHQDKMVVAPSRWYNNCKERPDIYYDDMILINV